MITLRELTHLLEAKKCGRGWIAKCPVHDDRNPSLSLGESRDGKVLFYCHAGCSQTELISFFKNQGWFGRSGNWRSK